MSSRKECIKNIEGTAPLELYKNLAKFGNENLGHIWDFTPEEVMKVMTCLTYYCIEEGKNPIAQELKDTMLKFLEWNEGEGKVKLITWAP